MNGMSRLSRRSFLSVSALVLTGCSSHQPETEAGSVDTPSPEATRTASASPTTRPTVTSSASPSASVLSQNPVPAPQPWEGSVQTALPGNGSYLAWTVDDGADPHVIREYALFAARTGHRLTFFVNGKYATNFEQNMDVLGPLVESGQLQIGNHTYSHTALTTLSDQEIQDELARNGEWVERTFGAQPAPYFRAPYGYYDQRVLAAAARVGYTRAVQWYGSFADSSPLSGAQILDCVTPYIQPQAIIIGHLNYPGITEVFDRVDALIREKNLQTVTLADYFQPVA